MYHVLRRVCITTRRRRRQCRIKRGSGALEEMGAVYLSYKTAERPHAQPLHLTLLSASNFLFCAERVCNWHGVNIGCVWRSVCQQQACSCDVPLRHRRVEGDHWNASVRLRDRALSSSNDNNSFTRTTLLKTDFFNCIYSALSAVLRLCAIQFTLTQ